MLAESFQCASVHFKGIFSKTFKVIISSPFVPNKSAYCKHSFECFTYSNDVLLTQSKVPGSVC